MIGKILALSFLLASTLRAEPAIRFRDAAADWGLEFHHHHGGSGERYMVETMVGGVVIFDFDGDGDPDVFFVDGGVLPGYEGEAPVSRLFRNDGGRFVDVTAGSGIAVADYGAGAVAGDVDGDGDLDLYVTEFGRNQLFANDGDGTFTDVTAAAGVGETLWSMGAAFADVDLDGDLDLYVANYVDFSLDNHVFCGIRSKNIRSYCHPDAYEALPDRFYLNRGDGTFEDATRAAGFAEARGKGLGVIFGDLTNDGAPDLYVANDMTPNFVFLNRGAGRRGAGAEPLFEDDSLLSGATYGDRGGPEAGMGVEIFDYDGDGLFDLFVTNFELETNALYKNEGAGLFTDVRFPSGVAEPSLLKLTFGIAFADLDLDGDQDFVVANGHINDNAELIGSETPYKQPNQVFERDGQRFSEVPDAGLDAVRASRGLAVGDLDLDGDEDVVIVNSNDWAEVYENTTIPRGSWLAVDLEARAGNRFAVGARLELDLAQGRAWREVRTGSSYLSQNEMRVHFGTGKLGAGRLAVRWPDGGRCRFENLPLGRRLRITRTFPAHATATLPAHATAAFPDHATAAERTGLKPRAHFARGIFFSLANHPIEGSGGS